MRVYLTYLFFGVLFVAVQTFWVAVIWNGDVLKFLLELVIADVLFVSATYGIARLYARFVFAEVLLYLTAGIIGLVLIEWVLVGSVPAATEANQFVMFTTWAGAATFARMVTDRSAPVAGIRRFGRIYFYVYAGIVTITGLVLLAVGSPLSFDVTYIGANVGYPLMVPVFIAFMVAGTRARLRELRPTPEPETVNVGA